MGGALRGPAEDLTVEKVEDGCAGISFPPHVSKSVATALRRVHQNMGHPSNNDLARGWRERRICKGMPPAPLPDL